MSGSSNTLVLFVDDEPRALRGYRDAMRKQPYDILTAGSGTAALEILSKAHVDVLIADERMPSMTGSELLERVRRDHPDVVRIMLTGEASLEASVRAIKGGVYAFLTKPIEPQELSRVIADAVAMAHSPAGAASTTSEIAARAARARAAVRGLRAGGV